MAIQTRTESEVNALCVKFILRTLGKFILVCIQFLAIVSMLWVLLNVLIPLIGDLSQAKLP